MFGQSRFLIFNRETGDYRKLYGTKHMPSLYLTRRLAQGWLSTQWRAGKYQGYEVVEVTIEERWKQK